MTSVVKVNSEFLVNTVTAGDQTRPIIASLADGHFLVSWQTIATSQGQIFDSAGQKVGSEFTFSGGIVDSVQGLPDGGFVAFQEYLDSTGLLGDSSGTCIRAQAYGADGVAVGDAFLVNTLTDSYQADPQVTALADGRYVVSWRSDDPGGSSPFPLDSFYGPNIKAQIFDANWSKVGDELMIPDVTKDWQLGGRISALSGGGFVVTWVDWSQLLGDTRLSGIAARVFDANGVAVGDEFLVNTAVLGNQENAAVAGLAGGGFVVTWQDWAGTSPPIVRARLYDASGKALGDPFRVGDTAGAQYTPQIVGLPNGDFVITWRYSGSWTIKAQVFDPTGAAIGSELIVNTSTVKVGSGQYIESPHIAAVGDSEFAITWFDNSGTLGDSAGFGIRSQIFSVVDNVAPVIASNGGGDGAAVSIAENSLAVTNVAATDADAGNVLRYAIAGGADAALFRIDAVTGALAFRHAPDFDFPSDAGGNNVYDVVVQVSDGKLTDTQAIAVTVTDIVNERIIGTSGADILKGAAGNDTLKGGKGADTLYGNGGNDVLDGGPGADRMEGGPGNDIYYVDDTGDRVIEGAGAGIDKVVSSIAYTLPANVEKLTLSGTAGVSATGNDLDNLIYANSGANTLTGGGGNDVLYGREGADTLYGGTGNDVLDGGTGADRMEGGTGNDSYVVDNPGDLVVEVFGGGTDKVRSSISYVMPDNVEVLTLVGSADLVARGNNLVNIITGNAGDNTLFGGWGRDTLYGGAGNDTLYGGADNDVLTGGAGQDFFVFDTAPNAITNLDRIRDFSFSDNDKIDLAAGIFTGFKHLGVLIAEEFHAAAGASTAHDATDRVIYDTATGRLYYDADGAGGTAAILFAIVGAATHPTFAYSDFAVI